MERSEKDRRVDEFKDEYFQLQSLVDSFDTKTLTIKAWSVTVGLSGIGGAFITQTPILLLLTSFSAFVFWLLESYWKSFQYPHYDRINDIEEYVLGKTDSLERLQISKSWERYFSNRNTRQIIAIMMYLNVLTPHLYIVLCGVIIFIAHGFCIVKI